ncbi:Globin-coupled histidine kinase [Rubripirellula tenax]|uniref:histidine kinase n=1 Tax=Rubripirellula tenax TaxID=2528015 RepID=A0A5C6EAZ4_9BACT|nr:ATP-binding protein [Rubripirellula tenax]TWU46132.1 Globin-coupled histidine kinase [Rubripirellula tenax]
MADEFEILLVEDDPDTQANLADILAMDGYRIRVAGTFSEVLDAGPQAMTGLVILDRKLPDGEAEDYLPRLKKLLPNAEFIVATGHADLEHTITAFKLGIVDYIIKPVHPEVIRSSAARIARQQQIERELHQEQQFANKVLSTAEAIILVLDLAGKVVRFNSYFTSITGWQLDDLRGRDWFDHCIPERNREKTREVFYRTAHDGQTSGILNSILTTKGREREIRWSNTTLKDDVGDTGFVLAVGVDVTDLIAAQEATMQSQRLAAIGQTVAGLAHESRNALHRIQTNVEILQLDILPGADLRDEVDSIHRAALELTNTLEEVRQYAAPIQLQRESVMLSEVWQRVWGYLKSSRDGRDALLVESNGGCDCPVDVDVIRMEQVFRNLFENSLAACQDPIRIHLHCRCDSPGAILLDIEDNGPGLNFEQREKLFEPFYTTKTRGTGLGLSIVQRIVEAHGGQIQIAEPSSCGARFLIRLDKHESAFGNSCEDKGVIGSDA